MIRDRLVAVDHPGDDLAALLPELRDLCAKQIAECDAAIGRMRRNATRISSAASTTSRTSAW
jgi:hypothetical protein